jgi:hypothetical protein
MARWPRILSVGQVMSLGYGAPESIQAMLLAFQQAYTTSVPFREDGALVHDLAQEVKPVLEALAVAADADAGTRPVHEAYALLNLFCRRAGALGATPSAALSLLEAIVQSLVAAGVQVTERWRRDLSMVAVEGYSAGRDERVTRELKQAALRGQVGFLLAPRSYAGFLAGALDADDVEHVLEDWARTLLRCDAQSCLLDVSRLECAAFEQAARAVTGFCVTAQSLGVSVLLFAARGELRQTLLAVGLARSGATLVDEFDEALALALSAVGSEITHRRLRWARGLFRWPPASVR